MSVSNGLQVSKEQEEVLKVAKTSVLFFRHKDMLSGAGQGGHDVMAGAPPLAQTNNYMFATGA